MTSTFPSRILAVGISKPGGLNAIETLDLPFPSPEPNQIIVKVCPDLLTIKFIFARERN